MDNIKLRSMSRTIKWVPTLVGVLSIALGAVGLFLKTEDPEIKTNVMLFATLGILGLTLIIVGMGLSGLYEGIANLPKIEADDDDLLD